MGLTLNQQTHGKRKDSFNFTVCKQGWCFNKYRNNNKDLRHDWRRYGVMDAGYWDIK